MDEQIDGCIERWMNKKWMNRQMDKQIDKKMDGNISNQILNKNFMSLNLTKLKSQREFKRLFDQFHRKLIYQMLCEHQTVVN